MKKWILVISLLLISYGILSGIASASSLSLSSIVSVSSGGIIEYVENMNIMTPVSAVGNKLSVQLRGVDVQGMEYWPVPQDLRGEETSARYANIKSLGFNVVRHPFAVDCYNYDLFYPNGHPTCVNMGYTGDVGIDYRQLMTDITQWCLDNDLYIMWDTHRWIHDQGGSFDMQDIEIYGNTMRALALQMKGFPNVIIELANEPWVTAWRTFAQRGLDEVRNAGFTGLVVSPMGGSDCLPLFLNDPLDDPLDNIAYDMHIYWYHRPSWWTENTVAGVEHYFDSIGITELGETYPIFVGEFGAWDEWPDELLFVENAITVFEQRKWAWMTWVYHPTTVTNFGMIDDHDGTLNSYGQTVVSLVEQLAS